MMLFSSHIEASISLNVLISYNHMHETYYPILSISVSVSDERDKLDAPHVIGSPHGLIVLLILAHFINSFNHSRLKY